MIRKQVFVFVGMMLAGALLLFLGSELDAAWPALSPVGDDTASRLGLVGRWLVLPGLSLLVGIGATANRRFFSSAAMDGGEEGVSRSLEINLRYNRNTLEQLVLAAIAWVGLALSLPQNQLKLIPALAVLFVVGRATFWIGYLIAPWARAFGFGLTFYPTVAAYVWLSWRLVD